MNDTIPDSDILKILTYKILMGTRYEELYAIARELDKRSKEES